MLITELYKGQGFGNQLWCYVTTRVLALDLGYKFGIMRPENFKGDSFMKVDFGESVRGGSGPEGGPPHTLPETISQYYREMSTVHSLNGSDTRLIDHNLLRVSDNTKIDGCLQDEQYIAHRKDEISEWLKIDPNQECYDYSNDDTCIINFRGSGYVNDKEFFLPQRYWDNAILNMRKINPGFRFVVITEDVKTARMFFPNFEVCHFSLAKDYIVIKNAHYIILSNSSFAWFPTWLNKKLRYCIAPKYWARHNISDGYWSLGYNITSGWMYQDRKGNLQDYDSCMKELDEFKRVNPGIFTNQKPPKTDLRTLILSRINIINALRKDFGIFAAAYRTTLVSAVSCIFRLKGRFTISKTHQDTSTKNGSAGSFVGEKNTNKDTYNLVKKFLIKQSYY